MGTNWLSALLPAAVDVLLPGVGSSIGGGISDALGLGMSGANSTALGSALLGGGIGALANKNHLQGGLTGAAVGGLTPYALNALGGGSYSGLGSLFSGTSPNAISAAQSAGGSGNYMSQLSGGSAAANATGSGGTSGGGGILGNLFGGSGGSGIGGKQALGLLGMAGAIAAAASSKNRVDAQTNPNTTVGYRDPNLTTHLQPVNFNPIYVPYQGDPNRYGMGPQHKFFNNSMPGMARGGSVRRFADGGFNGPLAQVGQQGQPPMGDMGRQMAHRGWGGDNDGGGFGQGMGQRHPWGQGMGQMGMDGGQGQQRPMMLPQGQQNPMGNLQMGQMGMRPPGPQGAQSVQGPQGQGGQPPFPQMFGNCPNPAAPPQSYNTTPMPPPGQQASQQQPMGQGAPMGGMQMPMQPQANQSPGSPTAFGGPSPLGQVGQAQARMAEGGLLGGLEDDTPPRPVHGQPRPQGNGHGTMLGPLYDRRIPHPRLPQGGDPMGGLMGGPGLPGIGRLPPGNEPMGGMYAEGGNVDPRPFGSGQFGDYGEPGGLMGYRPYGFSLHDHLTYKTNNARTSAKYDNNQRHSQALDHNPMTTGGGFAQGGGFHTQQPNRYVQGPGDGRQDLIDAKLSNGEYVMDAETVAMLGNGDPRAGAQQLDQFRQNLRQHKGQALAKGNFSPNAKKPEQYMRSSKKA